MASDLPEWKEDILDNLRPGSRVLELGCGNGGVNIYLTNKGCLVHSIDISVGWCRSVCRSLMDRRLPTNIAWGDFTELPYPDNYFDCVVCVEDGINYVARSSDMKKIIMEVSRVLKGGGKLLLTMINPFYWYAIVSCLLNIFVNLFEWRSMWYVADYKGNEVRVMRHNEILGHILDSGIHIAYKVPIMSAGVTVVTGYKY